jgi:hypothetical protein
MKAEFEIRYGFLTGNLFAGWSSEEMETLDEGASVHSYADRVEAAIQKAFPTAEVSVVLEHAEGIVPNSCVTYVRDLSDPDKNCGLLEEDVELIGSDIYEAQEWLVLR